MVKQFLILLLICFSSVYASAQQEQQQAESKLEAFKLLFRPQPRYTDRARQKGVEGTVTLKVTFLLNGEIGDVIYVKESSKKNKLTSYGLVDEAIAAAKQIKFEPPKRNGQPYSVTRTVIYKFSVY